jgi:hypothetical protein
MSVLLGVDVGRRTRSTSTPGDLGREGVEPLPPEGAVPFDGAVEFLDRAGLQSVDACGPPRCRRGEPGVAQDAQVPGDRGLGDAELPCDDVGQRTGCPVPFGEEFREPASDGVTEDVEGVHTDTL